MSRRTGVLGLCFVLVLSLLSGCAQIAAAACSDFGVTLPVTDSTPPAAGSTNLFDAVKSRTANVPNGRYLMLSMLVGAYLESGWNPNASDGFAFGVFQIQEPGVIHPDITVAQAEDIAYATWYMASRYRKGFNQVGPLVWVNPIDAAEKVAAAAESPAAHTYYNRGVAVVVSAYKHATALMAANGVDASSFPIPGFGGQQILSPVQPGISACNSYSGTSSTLAAKVLAVAEAQLGVPYLWGGETPITAGSAAVFDCSGLTQYSLLSIGLHLQRTSQAQWLQTKQYEVPLSQAQPGDLIFFAGGDGTMQAPGHVAFVVDPQKGIGINAPRTGDVVSYFYYLNAPDFVGVTDPYLMIKGALPKTTT